MEKFKADDRSAYAQATKRRDGAMREMFTGAQRREDRPMRRTPTAVSGVWLFLLSSLARRNGLLSFRFRQRR